MLVSYQKHIFSHDFDNVCIVNPSTSLGIHLFDFANEFRMFWLLRLSQEPVKREENMTRSYLELRAKCLIQELNRMTRRCLKTGILAHERRLHYVSYSW